MHRITRLEGAVQRYAWGSHSFLAELRGRPAPSDEPEAELWLGAHPRGSARVLAPDGPEPLGDWVGRDPEAVLGPAVRARFGAELPFLLKVLAVAKPLSIQVHPDAEQARAGYAREQAAGIALDAAERCYPDASAKPELVYALTRFEVLHGLREPSAIRDDLDGLGAGELAPRDGSAGALRAALASWLDRAPNPLRRRAVTAARSRADAAPRFARVAALDAAFPGDPGALAPLYLRALRLEPGEALFVAAGELHAYLEGAAVELMACSDNVLRGGLTAKHVALDELLGVARVEPVAGGVLAAEPAAAGVARFRTPAREFELAVLEPAPDAAPCALGPGVGVVLCATGRVRLCAEADPEGLALEAGQSALVPAAAGAWRASGAGRLFAARVPAAG